MDREQKLDEVITAYLKSAEAGQPVDQAEWLKRYSDLAGELAEFFASQQSVERVASPLRERPPSPPWDPGPGVRGGGSAARAGEPPAPRPSADAPTLPPTSQVDKPTGPETVAPDTDPLREREAAIQPGDRVRYFGDYELLDEIARGGMGVVYKARQVSLNRVVALKMILAGHLAGEADVKRFYSEAQTAANLQHPNIVAIHEVGEHKGQHYFSMDFVEGKSLAALVREHPLPPEQAAAIVKTVAEAIHYAHTKGVLHRDLKPANILLESVVSGQSSVAKINEPSAAGNGPLTTDHGRPRVTDFGLAKQIEADSKLTATGAVLGTPSYMPPEQASADRGAVGPTTDVYSLGAVLYELVTGRPPFQGPTPMDILLQVLSDDPVPPRQLQPKLPANLETICLKCLHKEPGKRYATAADLAEDLRRFLAGEPILARPTGSAERLFKWVKRRPVVAALVASVVLVTVAGVGGISWALGTAVAERNKYHAQKTKAERQLLRAEWLLYASRIAPAQQAWESDNVTLAYHYLGLCHPDLRGWEHEYLFTLLTSNQQTWRGHTNEVRSLAVSADGTRVVTGSSDNSLKIWDAHTGQELRTLKEHTAGVTSVAVSADGKRIVSGSTDKTIKLWDATTGQVIRTLNGPEITSVALSADGQYILSAGLFNNSVTIWSVATGEMFRTLKGHEHFVMSIAVSRDGKQIVSGSYDDTVKLWDATTGKNLMTFKGHTGKVNCVALSGDGRRIVSGDQDYAVKIWDTATGKEIQTLKGHSAPITSVAISADGTRVVSGSVDKLLKVWDLNKEPQVITLKGHTSWISSVVLSPDGKRIISGSRDGNVKIWDANATQQTPTLQGHTAGVLRVALSQDGKTAVTGSYDRTVRIWDVATRSHRILAGHMGHVGSVAISADGTRIVSGSSDKTLKIWNALTGAEMRTLEGHTNIVTGVAFSPDGRFIVSASSDKTLKIWKADTGEEIRALRGHADRVHCLAISSDGVFIVSGGHDQTLKLWYAATGRCVRTLEGHAGGVSDVAFSHDGKHIVSGSDDQTVKIWNTESGEEVLTLRGHTDRVNAIAVSSDGKRIISGSNDQTIKVWSAAIGQETLTLKGHSDGVSSVALSVDGRRVLSGSSDTTVKVWDASMQAPRKGQNDPN